MLSLCDVDVTKRLTLPFMNSERLDLPFLSANVDHLDHNMVLDDLLESDLQNLNIRARKLSLIIHLSETFPTEPARWLFWRMAELGHFVELKIKFYKAFRFESSGMPLCALQALLHVTRANRNLEILDLSEDIERRG